MDFRREGGRGPAQMAVTADSKRCTTCPLRSTRNLVKFHLISAAIDGSVCLVRYWYSGVWSSPFTDTLLYRGNVTLYLREQKVLISSFVPGSCRYWTQRRRNQPL